MYKDTSYIRHDLEVHISYMRLSRKELKKHWIYIGEIDGNKGKILDDITHINATIFIISDHGFVDCYGAIFLIIFYMI